MVSVLRHTIIVAHLWYPWNRAFIEKINYIKLLIYISKYLLRSLGWILLMKYMYSSFTVFWILIQMVLIRLLPYLTYKFNINERVDVNQDGPWVWLLKPNSYQITSIFYMLLEDSFGLRNIFQNIHKASKIIYIYNI